jgi:ethanolamine kinase
MAENLRHIDLYYDNADSQNTALALILALRPEWERSKETVEFVRFKDGITNTVCGRQARISPRTAMVSRPV